MYKLIVGLGNPGEKYSNTRHNAGFEVLDALIKKYSATSCSSRFEAQVCEFHWAEQKIFLLKPTTFMNNSGIPLGEFARFYKIEASQILVIHDDLDLPLGHLRLAQGGSSGGHNGVQSVIDNFGPDFYRLKIGIGSNRDTNIPAEDFVLQRFQQSDSEVIQKSVSKILEITSSLLEANDLEKIKFEIANYNASL